MMLSDRDNDDGDFADGIIRHETRSFRTQNIKRKASLRAKIWDILMILPPKVLMRELNTFSEDTEEKNDEGIGKI